jgi:ribosome-associated translation inhibitor RaiA
MNQNLQIVSSGVDLSDAMRSAITGQASRLEKSAGRLHGVRGCHVHIDRPVGGANHLYNVRVRVTIDDKELVANNYAHPDFYVALRHGFEAIIRQMRDFRQARAAAALHAKPISAHLAPASEGGA